ncbi:CDP-diacylglycerol--glycerol-3-phosphate 3-phosphatidyltransferase [Pedobacter sp. ok626]|uniref:CDP-alcohol phosphatidyltransferase family protein n=1 Tax=Pedobacter sp. ok626 TaxID=1761882 RepID=UPI000884837C|nr:CDP-alcohol phosphatidyltransferase family protein [Pedobacter sp. ok626]SDJ71120.1 CDP-diacylglycerol--glycerol-3-phosphate 3-phosphatidyltransferase [Pedobacter sp. ok626]
MSIPYLLILFRLLLAPVILGLGFYWGSESRFLILILMYLGLISDIFDGIIARKQGLSTEKMRRLDSQTDLIFWIAVAISCYLIYPEAISDKIYGVVLLIIMEAVCYMTSIIKFGKETCTHAFVSKMWGLTLLAAFTSLLAFGYGGWSLNVTIIVGLISHIDVLLIILLLPKWTHDVPSFYHAYLIRNGRSFKKSKYLNS